MRVSAFTSLRRAASGRVASSLLGASSLLAASLILSPVGAPRAQAQDALRPAVATPLSRASAALSRRRLAEATRDVDQAAAVRDLSSSERLTIAEMRASIASASGDPAAEAATAHEVLVDPALPASERPTFAAAEASADDRAGKWAAFKEVVAKYFPHDPRYAPLLINADLATGDCPDIVRMIGANRSPSEDMLRTLAYCQGKSGDVVGYRKSLAALVRVDPSPANWATLIGVVASVPGVETDLGLDFFRLRMARQQPIAANEYMQQSEAALEAGLPNLANRIITAGFDAKVLGTGPDAVRQGKLRALVGQRLQAANAGRAAAVKEAETSNNMSGLFTLGLDAVDGGQAAQGLGLMQAAIGSHHLGDPDQAALELGIAYRESGNKAQALRTWAAIPSKTPAGAMATAWELLP